MSKSFPKLNISIAWPVTIMQFHTILSYHLRDYNYSCILALVSELNFDSTSIFIGFIA